MARRNSPIFMLLCEKDFLMVVSFMYKINFTPLNKKLFKFLFNKVEPTSGFCIVCISVPPVTPEVIQIQVLRT